MVPVKLAPLARVELIRMTFKLTTCGIVSPVCFMATNYISNSCLPIKVYDFGFKDGQIKECSCLVTTLLLEEKHLKLYALLMMNQYCH